MEFISEIRQHKNILVTIAIGDKYLNDWKRHSYPSWKGYCEKHDLGLLVITDSLINQSDPKYKKPTWQKGLLGNFISEHFPFVTNVCYLDTDIIISPLAPNIFESYEEDGIGLVSLRHNLPFPYELVRRRMAFLRNRFYSNDYPLDSSLFISLNDLYEFHSKSPQDDEACMGLIVFNIKKHSQILLDSFNEYDSNVESITGGGDQFHYNYEFQNRSNVQWFPYEFQSIWCHEMAWFYPSLYSNPCASSIKNAIEATLMRVHFLHFAGSWNESEMWTSTETYQEGELSEIEAYKKYLSQEVTGVAVGQRFPQRKK